MATTAHASTILHTCSVCQARSEIPVAEMVTARRCPACNTGWRIAEPISVDETAFPAIRDSARLPIVIAFCAPRSEPSRRLTPDLQAVAREFAGQALFLKVDPEQSPELGYDYRVGTLPHLLLLWDGEVVAERDGAITATELRRWLCAHVDPGGERPVCRPTFARLCSRFLQGLALFAGLLSAASHRKQVRSR